jgi:hypothetical protein
MVEISQVISDQQLTNLTGIHDLDELARSVSGKKVLILGGGDLARKKQCSVALLKRLGARVYLVDVQKHPKALETLGPYLENFFLLDNGVEENALVEQGQKEPFHILDISTWGNSHLAMAFRFQDIAALIVATKPVDTHLDLLRTIHSYHEMGSPLFRRLVDRLLVHDHYGARWVLLKAGEEMIHAQRTEGFVTELQIYITEYRSVNEEMERIEALQDGICHDLLPHAFRVMQSLLPIGVTWECGNLQYTRRGLSLAVTGGARERNIGCAIDTPVETFAAVSLKGEDIVDIAGQKGRIGRFPFRCLMVVGKGVTARAGDDKDVKGVSVRFQTGKRLDIDLDSQRMRTPRGDIILPPRDVLHRGINLPLIELTKAGLPCPLPASLMHYFQPLEAAYQAAEFIAQASQLPWLEQAYPQGVGCIDLINRIPREWWGAVGWQLRQLPEIQIGVVPADTLSVP